MVSVDQHLSPSKLERLRRSAKKRFFSFYPKGFDDPDYIDLERSYKWRAHEEWRAMLERASFENALIDERYTEIAAHAVRVESRTNLLFSFEKMALRDAVKSRPGAKIFSEGLFEFLYGEGAIEERFEKWVEAVGMLPRRQTRVLTWPVLTVFPFIAEPKKHLYLKPTVTRIAAERWGFPFQYASKPTFATYRSLLTFGRDVKAEVGGRDQIDVQGFIWVLGSTEYD
jgi:hypothetical protein